MVPMKVYVNQKLTSLYSNHVAWVVLAEAQYGILEYCDV